MWIWMWMGSGLETRGRNRRFMGMHPKHGVQTTPKDRKVWRREKWKEKQNATHQLALK
jgi:hypothetical protein